MAEKGPSKKDLRIAEAMAESLKEMTSITDDIAASFQNVAAAQSEVLSAADQSVNIASQERKLIAEIGKMRAKDGKFIKGLNKDVLFQMEAYKEVLAVAKAQNKMQQQTKKGLQAVNDVASDLVGNIKGFVDALPGGGMLSKLVGLDGLAEGFEGALNMAGDAFMGAMKAGASSTQAMQAGMTAFSGAASMLLNPVTLIVAAIAGLVMVYQSVSKEAKKLTAETGLTYGQSKQLVKEANNYVGTLGNALAKSEDVLAVQQESINAFGTMAMLTTEQAGEVANIGKAFGYGAKQAGEVNAAFMAMGVSGDEAAAAQRDLAAEAMKAGVNVGTVTADIAKNSKATSKYFGGNVKALKKAAIEAAKMGVSLETMAKVSDGLLDFENSITAQFELQALTGKQMNFDLARQLALEGDIAGATQAVLDQVGSIHDFNQMDVLERKKLAEATGMDVDELQKSLTIKDKMGNLTSEELASMNALGLSAAEMASMSSEELQNRLAQQQASEKSAANFAAMKAQLVNALMPAAEAFMGVFAALSPILKVIGGVFKLIGGLIKGILAPVQAIFDIFSYIGDAVYGIIDSLGILDPMVAVLSFAFDAIKNTIMIAGGILATVFLPNILAAAGGAIVAAGSFIASAIPAIFSAFGMIPFGLGIPLAIAAVAGMIATTMSYMNDGVISSSTGGSGYGSRVLFGPEGAISFNNKDTIVAGTNLFGQANDAMFAPKGALKMNDGAVGDMPDPPEAKIVGITGESVVKLSTGIAAMMGTVFGPSMVAALALSMPIIGATITGAIVAGAAATALIPKPVLILNPVLPVFETNPIMMMGSFLGGLFGGGDEPDSGNAEIVAKLDEVKMAIANIEINMDGKKVGMMTRLADSFRR